ncbi:hypothetical protein [Labrenzia sp. DG1229]|uniref:hypothetical protein n=1 Tax=Labrenzia sp. DG1229 TaxID=681847 RepID=UPI00048BD579|nr:hypothetical protein [Labrenzia sp. DG1229]
MIAGIAFAGVTGVGKSTMFRLVTSKLVSREDTSLLVLRNNLIQTRFYETFSATGSLDDLTAFLASPLRIIEQLTRVSATWPSRDVDPKTVVMAESWLLNLCAELRIEPMDQIEYLDNLRASANLAIVRLSFPSDLVAERSVISTRRYRGPGWGRYLDQMGNFDAQVAEFQRRRDVIDRLFEICRPPKLSIDTSRMDWAAYADEMLEYMRFSP